MVSYQAILFSVVGAAIAIGTRPELADSQTTIYLTLNHSVAPGETLVVPVVNRAPPTDIANAIWFFYESSLVSLLAVIFAILAKECLSNYHLREEAVRSEGCQGKLGALDSWRFCLLAKTPHLLLRIALAYLILGFWERLYSGAHPITICTLVILIVPGLVGYFGTVINLVRMS